MRRGWGACAARLDPEKVQSAQSGQRGRRKRPNPASTSTPAPTGFENIPQKDREHSSFQKFRLETGAIPCEKRAGILSQNTCSPISMRSTHACYMCRCLETIGPIRAAKSSLECVLHATNLEQAARGVFFPRQSGGMLGAGHVPGQRKSGGDNR
jgi:hypothetical protein